MKKNISITKYFIVPLSVAIERFECIMYILYFSECRQMAHAYFCEKSDVALELSVIWLPDTKGSTVLKPVTMNAIVLTFYAPHLS